MDWYNAIAGRLNLLDWAEGLVRAILYKDLSPVRVSLPYPTSSWWEENPDVSFWNYSEILQLLDDYHVKVFWRGFNEREIWGHIPQRQARFCEYLLHRAGAIPPATMQTVDERNQTWANDPRHNGAMPARWDDRERSFKEREARG